MVWCGVVWCGVVCPAIWPGGELKLVDDKDRGTICQNLTEVPVDSPAEVLKLLQMANARSHISATRMNKMSKYVAAAIRRAVVQLFTSRCSAYHVSVLVSAHVCVLLAVEPTVCLPLR